MLARRAVVSKVWITAMSFQLYNICLLIIIQYHSYCAGIAGLWGPKFLRGH